MHMFFKKAAEIADGVLDLASWFGTRIESKKVLARPEDLVGVNAEVTATIQKGAAGEVVVVVADSKLNYSARAFNNNVEYKKGEMVNVVSAGSSVLYVTKDVQNDSNAGGQHRCNHDH